MIVTFVNLKGGVGKTTSAVYLAVALQQHGTVQLIDTDPQRSLMKWAEAAQPAFPHTVARLGRPVSVADTEGADFTIIDTPPGGTDAINAAINVAQLVIVPTRPSHIDANQTVEMVDRIAAAGVPATILVVAALPRRVVVAEVREYLGDLPAGSSLYEHVVPFREHAARAYGSVPRLADLYPYDLLATDVKDQRSWF